MALAGRMGRMVRGGGCFTLGFSRLEAWGVTWLALAFVFPVNDHS